MRLILIQFKIINSIYYIISDPYDIVEKVCLNKKLLNMACMNEKSVYAFCQYCGVLNVSSAFFYTLLRHSQLLCKKNFYVILCIINENK